ncbi:hypothetical protein [Shewanella xiamenensis]|uniref:hypothetical protein n=1 Tax=Shewanella xiamenensis TaxID=332186 RepID=UPI00118640D2|nr:hypothetical protein [Shewanella xiamenensis]TVL32927.1 hypothetical protein AYI95_08385 [Shewanella xiamenensis]
MTTRIIPYDSLKPYLSILVGEIDSSITIESIHDSIKNIIKESSEMEDSKFSKIEKREVGKVGSALKTNYEAQKKPSWTSQTDIYDLENHCFITLKSGKFIAVYFSENGRKDEIRENFTKGTLEKIKPVSINQLYHHFVNEDEVKMLWLSDISGKSSFKVGSKVLGGDSVADTLDPILDQYYMMSAVRTKMSSQEDAASIGINPFKSSIWRGPCSTWQEFEDRTLQILDKLNSKKEAKVEPISILAYPIFDMEGVSKPYDFTIVEYEALPSNSPERVKILLEKFESDYHFEQIEEPIDSCRITLDLYLRNEICATYTLHPYLENHYVKIDYDVNYAKGKKSAAQSIEQIFNKPELIKCWFETSHAWVGGMIFKTEYRDVDFTKFIWADFEDYDIFCEKPLNIDGKVDLKLIGKQKSIFCWIKNFWSSDWGNKDNFITSEIDKGWLYCDDGSGEKADFIHFKDENGSKLLTFIHIKAAHKRRDSNGDNRRLSVGAHDIVVNQAIKNLRYYDRKKLHEALDLRIEEATHKVCWYEKIESSAQEFLKALKCAVSTSHVQTRVVIIQPHTRKSVYEKVDSNNNIKRQLDTLLVSANNAISATNTEFYVIGFND